MTDAYPMTDVTLNQYLSERMDDPAVRLFAETTAAMRNDAGYLAREDDAAGAAFLDDEAPAEIGATALDHVLARIEAAEAADQRAKARADAGDPRFAEIAALPSPLRDAALDALAYDRWRMTKPGLIRLPLDFGATHCELMRIDPGKGAAPHDHDADELTLILTGAYFDGHDHYGPGDVSLAQPGFVHNPKAKPGDVCYVLAVTYGPARFKGAVGVLQRTIGYPWEPKPAPKR